MPLGALGWDTAGMASQQPQSETVLHVDIKLKTPEHHGGHIDLGSSFHLKETDKHRDVLLRAKVALIRSLTAHHASGYCDYPVVLDDKEFIAAIKQIAAFRLSHNHVHECDCDEYYGFCMSSDETGARAAKAGQ